MLHHRCSPESAAPIPDRPPSESADAFYRLGAMFVDIGSIVRVLIRHGRNIPPTATIPAKPTPAAIGHQPVASGSECGLAHTCRPCCFVSCEIAPTGSRSLGWAAYFVARPEANRDSNIRRTSTYRGG